jgi:hypothetical protein
MALMGKARTPFDAIGRAAAMAASMVNERPPSWPIAGVMK